MTRIALFAALCMPCLAIGDSGPSAKSALSEYFTFEQQGPRLVRGTKTTSLEICFDTCDYYRGSSAMEAQLWDLAFLHQYYLNTPYHLDQFRARYAAPAKEILKLHAEGCQAKTEKEAARCAIARLAGKMNAAYAFVRYDEGARCQVARRLTDPTFQGKGSCKQLR
jgi:hypothetical protein